MCQRYFLTKNILSISFPNTFKDDCTDEIVFIYIDYALLKSLNCNAYVRSVAFDSYYLLASGSRDNTVKLWNKNSGVLSRTLTGHGKLVYIVTFDFTYLLASGIWDDTIKIWNKNSEDLLWTLTGHGGEVNSVAIDSIYLLASGSDDETIKI